MSACRSYTREGEACLTLGGAGLDLTQHWSQWSQQLKGVCLLSHVNEMRIRDARNFPEPTYQCLARRGPLSRLKSRLTTPQS
jgi:hypothetical protein